MAPRLTTPAFLHLLAERRPAAGGLGFRGRVLSWGLLADAVDGLAAWLARRGLGGGRHVGVMAANEPALVATAWAIWGLGDVYVPIAARATAAEAARLLAHAPARALFCAAARAPGARDAAAAAGVPAYVCEPDLPLAPRVLRRGRAMGARSPRLAAIAYTSGTTASPKGVMLTHEQLLWATLACAHARGDGPDAVGACLSPLTHTPVLVSHLLCRVLLGATAVLLERFDVGAVLDAVDRFAITDLPLIGGMVHDVVRQGGVPRAVRESIRKVSVGGAPTSMDAKQRLAAIFDRAEVIEAYGQTESTDGVTMARGTSVFDRPGTVGRPNPHLVVAVQRGDGRRCAPDEEGEIVVRGPTVMAGYHRDRRATAAAIRGGWLRTGDVGRQDAEGWLFVTGRLKDLIITGGENVSPVEIEEVLRAHPDVADVAVIGTPHPRWGEQVTAIVVRRTDAVLNAEGLTAWAGTRLAGYKKPRRVEFVAALPRNASNKVETGVLRARFATDVRS
jgi:fatty-acyl-CoA synthase